MHSTKIIIYSQANLDPKCGAFANGCQLCWLEMSEPQCGQITILGSKVGEARDENTKRMNEVCEAFAQKYQVGVTTEQQSMISQTETIDNDKTVLSDIARSCTQAINPNYFGKNYRQRKT